MFHVSMKHGYYWKDYPFIVLFSTIPWAHISFEKNVFNISKFAVSESIVSRAAVH